MASSRHPRHPLPRSYVHVPRTILWLVPGGEFLVDGRTESVEPFYLGKWPITNEQFEAFDPDYRRSPLSPADRDVAVGVSWNQADAYCRWYAEVSRKPMRLPTRTEWLYACRGLPIPDDQPSWTVAPDAIDRHCWHAGNSEGRVQPPEKKEANDFGLHGMLGSVWEWIAENPADAPDQRTLCGGSFRLQPHVLREGAEALANSGSLHSQLVRREAADFAASDTGFRVARSFRLRPRTPRQPP